MTDERREPIDIDGLRDLEEIGRGGFGTVYRATETDLDRIVAVKVLAGRLDERARDRFDRERRAMGALSGHPNIVMIHRTGFTDDDRPFLVMEYVAKGAVTDLPAGTLGWDDVVVIGVHLAGATETAHRRGVLHRDIKPANILLSENDTPKLADFGIARLKGGPETTSAVITASIAHAPPEVIAGKRPDARSDVYSLASSLYEMLAGSAPFARPTDESLVPMLARIAQEPVPDLRAQSVPPAVCEALESAMAKDPDDRPATAHAFGESLRQAQIVVGRPATVMTIFGADSAPPAADATTDISALAATPPPPAAEPAPPAPAAATPPPAPTPAPAPNPASTPSSTPSPSPSPSLPPPPAAPGPTTPAAPTPAPATAPGTPVPAPGTPAPAPAPAAPAAPAPDAPAPAPAPAAPAPGTPAPAPGAPAPGTPASTPAAAAATGGVGSTGATIPPSNVSTGNVTPAGSGGRDGTALRGWLIGAAALLVAVVGGLWLTSLSDDDDGGDVSAGDTDLADTDLADTDLADTDLADTDSTEPDESVPIDPPTTPTVTPPPTVTTTTTTTTIKPDAGPVFGDLLGDSFSIDGLEDYPAYERYTHSSGAFTVEVPTAWADRDESLLGIDPSMAVSSDLNGSFGPDAWSAPGLAVAAYDRGGFSDLTSFVDALVLSDRANCQSDGRTPFDDGPYFGGYEVLGGCAGTSATVLHFGFELDGDTEHYYQISIQSIGLIDISAAVRILGTIEIDPAVVCGCP